LMQQLFTLFWRVWELENLKSKLLFGVSTQNDVEPDQSLPYVDPACDMLIFRR
jgi:hypothetical protein